MTRYSTLCAALVLVVLLAGCGGQDQEPVVQLRPVRSIEVVASATDSVRVFSGTTIAETDSTLSFRVAGTIVEKNVDVGDVVTLGQLLARLDPQPYQVQAREAEAGLAQATATLRNAEANYQRTRGLYENRNASRADLDAARASEESATAQVRSMQQQLEAARLQLSYTRLEAPQECSVAEIFAIQNENVSSGQPVMRVTCGDCAEAAVSVPETMIGSIRTGMPAEVELVALGGRLFPGVVKDVGVATSTSGSAYPVTVSILEGCDQVRAGMAADIRIRFSGSSEASSIIVPYVAVGEDDQGQFVFVLEQSEGQWVARRRAVRSGEFAESGIQIFEGLQSGERIATAGVRRLIDGQAVKLLDDEG